MLRNAKYVVHDGFPAVAWVANYGNSEDWSSDRFMLWLRILPREPHKTGVHSGTRQIWTLVRVQNVGKSSNAI
jgi:hypothetical protein